MAQLTAGINRDDAFALLEQHNKEEFHIEHALALEGTMRYFAHEFDPENEEFWSIVGLLHDLDWEEFPQLEVHSRTAEPWLREAGGTDELVHAIQSHNFAAEGCPEPELFMEKVLFAVDELTGLVGAAVLMRPSKSVMDLPLKSLKKKFKDKRFAAGCSRDVISRGAELCGWSLDELMERTIAAMQSFAPDRDTFQPQE
ncbi:MAG: HD family phosphohydrolase [Eggerthellaceae bacterium]|nr:HD family phosphohydrolase [Eggerthellaceae bacterium]